MFRLNLSEPVWLITDLGKFRYIFGVFAVLSRCTGLVNTPCYERFALGFCYQKDLYNPIFLWQSKPSGKICGERSNLIKGRTSWKHNWTNFTTSCILLWNIGSIKDCLVFSHYAFFKSVLTQTSWDINLGVKILVSKSWWDGWKIQILWSYRTQTTSSFAQCIKSPDYLYWNHPHIILQKDIDWKLSDCCITLHSLKCLHYSHNFGVPINCCWTKFTDHISLGKVKGFH